MQLSFAWEKWRELAAKKFDFNIVFQTRAVRILERQLGPEEEGPLRVGLLMLLCTLALFLK